MEQENRGPVAPNKSEVQTSFSPFRAEHSHGPLIARVTNQWQDVKTAGSSAFPEDHSRELRFCDLEDEESCPNLSRDLFKSRRFHKMVVYFLILLLILAFLWIWYVQPLLDKDWAFREGFLPSESNGTYGLAQAGSFEGVFIQDLDERLIPGGVSDPEGQRRLVFVGDIHGCADALRDLLAKARFDANTDHLITTGDVVSKGPDNLGVLDKLIELGATSVRGNHEDRLLEAAKIELGNDVSPHALAKSSKGYAKDAALLKLMHVKHLRYLRSMPLMLRIPALPFTHARSQKSAKDEDRITRDVIVVHAGLVPHVPLEKQDPYFAVNMRAIDKHTHLPSALRASKDGRSKPWIDIWNWYNEQLARGHSVRGFHSYTYLDWLEKQTSGNWLSRFWKNGRVTTEKASRPKPMVAIYGHDSKAGLQLRPWSKGLDSGCVAGGYLTALVLDAFGKTEIVQVSCGNRSD